VNDTTSYTIQYDPKAAKELGKRVARRIVNAVEGLRADPRPHSARPLVGYPHLWRIRIGDYRVVYTIKDAELVILALRIAHRSSVYRKL